MEIQNNRGKFYQHQQQNPEAKLQPPPSSSSPAHEFSFNISLRHQFPSSTVTSNSTPPSIAIDLSPADEIFFLGHLLPLHLSHLPPVLSPRSSTNSLDSFTLPVRDLIEPQIPTSTTTTNPDPDPIREKPITWPKQKPKSFSLFGISIRRKGDYIEEREKQRKKLKFDLNQVLKRYMRLVKPLFRGRRRENDLQLRRKPYSFSRYLNPRKYKQELRVKKGEFSAPVSMRTSPSNSGLLVGNRVVTTSTSDSTMEELQTAIQAAIAHCKNSISMEEEIIK